MGGSSINVLFIAIHESGGVDIDIRYGLHYGSGGLNPTDYVTSDISGGVDAWHYAHDHGSRDASWDNKMANAWGTQFSNLGGAYKDALWGYMHRKTPPQ